ncbi:MAG TPA: tetratricopeptide repeat protein [Thermoanaerobaculia bacterium]
MKQGVEALYTSNDHEAAITHFRTVLEKNPGHYGANYQIAVALDRAGKPDEARSHWEQVLKLAEANGDQPTLATAKARLGAPAAIDKQALWMAAGVNLMYDLNRPEDAATEFRKVLAENPTHYGATYQLATALDRAGKRSEATPLWENVLVWAVEYEDEATGKIARERLDRQ